MAFNRQAGTRDYGPEYRVNMTALFTLKLLLERDVSDVLVKTVENIGDFVYVMIRVEYYKKEPELYAIKLNHKQKEGARVNTNDFVKRKGEFALQKHKESYEAIVDKLEDENDILLKGISSNGISMCLLTTAEITDYKMFLLESKLLSCRLTRSSKQDSIKIAHSDEYYGFQISKPSESLTQHYSEILRDSFHLQISKSGPKIDREEIVTFFQDHLRSEFDKGESCYERAIETAQNKTKERYPKDSDSALIEFMAKYFAQQFKMISESEIKNLFQNAIATKFWLKKADEYSAFFQSFRFYDRQTNYEKAAKKIENLLKDSFGEDRPEITKQFIDFIKEHIDEVIASDDKLLNKRNAKLKLLELLTGITDTKKLEAKYDVFKDITNMNDDSQRVAVLKQIQVSLQGRPPLSLYDLAGHPFHETIPIQFLLRNINETIQVGTVPNKKPDHYIRRWFYKTLLRLEVLKETRNNIFVFDEAVPNYINLTLTVLYKPSVTDLIPFCFSKRNVAIVVNSNELIEGILNHESLNSFNVHHLKVYRPNCLEWSRSWRDIKSLNKYIVEMATDEVESEEDDDDSSEIESADEDDSSKEDECVDVDSNNEEPDLDIPKDELFEDERVDEEKVLQYFTNPLNIVSAIGGMGKSTMLQVLSDYCQSNTLALILDFKLHGKSLGEETNELRRNPLEYICNHMISQKDDGFETGLFHHLQQERRLMIFIDSFDELPTRHYEVVLSIVKELQKSEVPIWVFTRPIAHGFFQQHFPVIPLSMVDLTKEDAVCYLSHKLNATAEEVEGIPDNLLSAPLYLYMIAKTFTRLTDFQNLNDAELYERFTNMCFKEHMEKLNITRHAIVKSCELDYLKYHEIAALLSFFPEEYLVDNKIVTESDLQELVEHFEDCSNNFKLIVLLANRIPVFSHRTYAEYFLAVWIHKSLLKNKLVYEQLLDQELEPVRLMFDKICCKGNELLSAALENDLGNVEKLCRGSPKSDVCITDVLGRSPLHFLLSYLHQDFDSPENGVSMQIMGLLLTLDRAEIERRDKLMGLNCFEYAEKCGNTNLIHIAAYWGALKVLELVLPSKKGNRQENNFTPLHAAAMNDQVDCARYLIEMGADINSKDENGDTPMHCAAEEGFPDMLELLVEAHASINCKNNDGQTPVHCAADYGKPSILKVLLEKEINVDETDSKGCTALHLASRIGNRNCVKRLLKGGADINLKNEEEQTPLYCAGKDGHLDILKLLIRKNAEINETDAQTGNTALHAALMNGHEECAIYLLKSGALNNLSNKKGEKPLHLAAAEGCIRVLERLKDQNIHELDSRGNTPLHVVSWKGQKKSAIYLVNACADVNFKNKAGQTPLHLAAHAGHVNVLEYLAEKVDNINEGDSNGNTALHLASLHNKKESVISLIEMGAFVNSKNNRDQTPVHLAAIIGLVDVLDCLKERGANMNEIDSSGNTALHLPFMVTPFLKQCVFYLVKAGVDVNVKNKDGEVALHSAVYYRDIIKLLIENHANVDEVDLEGNTPLHKLLNESTRYRNSPTCREIASHLIAAATDVNLINTSRQAPVHLAAIGGHVDVMKLLKHKHANINVADRVGNTPLHLAIWFNSVECVTFLVEAGADINAKTLAGGTPFLIAAFKGHLDLLKLFKARKANIKEVDSYGNTPLHLTVTHSAMHDHVECVKFLVEEEEADIDAKNKDGKTPFDLAVCEEYLELLRLYKEKRAGIKEIDLHQI